MIKNFGILALAIIFVLGASQAAVGQGATASIVGRVSDSSGAVLPGVTITATNEGTGLRREAITNESGNYTIPLLPIGAYTAESQLSGFRTEIRRGVVLNVDARVRLDLTLQVGQMTENVQVTGESPLVQTEDSAVGFVVDNKKIVELPLNGRKFEQLVQLVPGAVQAAEGSLNANRGLFSIAGQPEVSSSFLLDGVDNIDPVVRIYAYRPSIDLIQEFKVQTSTYSAEFGRNSGAVVNVTTKSGTNEFHGSAWEFHRNAALNAKNFFDSPMDKIPHLVKNQFGVSMGGPIKQNKTFFFGLYEGQRSREAASRVASVPSLAWRRGDFSGLSQPIIDPGTGQAFSGNIIPIARFNPNSLAILNYIRKDGKLSFPEPNRGLLPNVSVSNYLGNPVTQDDINDFSGKIDHEFTLALRLSGRASYTRNPIFDPYGDQIQSDPTRRVDGYPTSSNQYRTQIGLNLSWVRSTATVVDLRAGYSRLNQPYKPLELGPNEIQAFPTQRLAFIPINIQGLDQIGRGGGFDRAVNTYNYVFSLVHTRGNHAMKFGADFRRYLFNFYTGGPPSINFNSVNRPGHTGFAFADFLLGLPDQTSIGLGDPAGHPRKFEMAYYFQNDWKLTPKITLNLGLRYEFYKRITERDNRMSGWDLATNSVIIAGQNGETSSLVHGDHNNFAPRFGFAYRPFGGSATVLKGGIGVFYDNDERHNADIINNYPRVVNQTFDDQLFRLSFTPAGAFPQEAARVASTVNINARDRNFPDTYSYQYNFGIQHQVLGGVLVDLTYVGSTSRRLIRTRDINQPRIVNGVALPRPYAGFARINYTEWTANSNYNSLQSRIEKRFAQGVTFISSYTFGKSIDDKGGQGAASSGTPQDSYDLRAERGISDFDVKHVYRFSWVTELPVGAGRRFMGNLSGPAEFLIGGWQLSGVFSAQSGRPFTPRLTGNNSGSFAGADRPDLIGDPKLSNPDPNTGWVNAAAFRTPAPLTFGNSGRNIVLSDGLQSVDLTLGKVFKTTETTRLEFRSEFFNVLNHPNFGLPNATVNSPQFGTVGRTSTTSRQIQFGVRFQY